MAREENVKERIIESSIRLFLAHGFTGTSVKDLTEAAGVAKGTLYCHFTSKDQVLESILDKYSVEFLERLVEKVTNCDGDFVTRFKVFYRYTTEFARDHRDLLLVFNTLLGEIIGSGSMAETKMKQLQGKHNRFVEDMLNDGQKEGIVDRGLDSHIYAHIVTATFTGMLLQWYLNGDVIGGSTEYSRSFRDAMMRTLGISQGKSSSREPAATKLDASKGRGV